MDKSLKIKCVLPLLLFFLLFPPLPAKAQEINELFQSVVYLHGKGIKHEESNGMDYEIWLKGKNEAQPHPYETPCSGTGFFVGKGSHIYLITAEHLARNLRLEVKVTVHGPEDRPLTYDIQELTGSQQEQPWFFHSEADVGILPLKPSGKFKGVVKILESNMLLSDDSSYSPYRDRVFTTIGFPLGLGVRGKFSPIIRSSRAASDLLTYERFDKKIETTFLLLDDPSVAGFSGAPVYAMSAGQFGRGAFGASKCVCIGLVHCTVLDNTGGKFAAIVPSWFILQTIEKFENTK